MGARAWLCKHYDGNIYRFMKNCFSGSLSIIFLKFDYALLCYGINA
jgi:hypothetical protein